MTSKNLSVLVGVVVLLLAAGVAGLKLKGINVLKFEYSQKNQQFPRAVSLSDRLFKGGDIFSIASAEGVWPRFVEAEIDPIKVSIGDIQRMRVVVENTVEMTGVVAEIETDNGTTTVPLRLTERRALTQADLDVRKYLVGEQNKLVVVPDWKITLNRMFHTLIPTVNATGRELFTYEGEWQVHDTSVREYTTVFVARDVAGRENRITLAWYDPCGIPNGGDWTVGANCSLTGPGIIETGVDNGNMSFAGAYTVAVSNSAVEYTKFAWNPGKSITINNGGQLMIGQKGSFIQTYLWWRDDDGDNYAPPLSGGTWYERAEDTAPGNPPYRRRYLMIADTDCNDGFADVYPGAPPVPNSNNSGDHNCDGSIVKGFESSMYSQGYDSSCIVYLPDSYLCGDFVPGIHPTVCGGGGMAVYCQ